jgi:hypothetical protein
MGARSNGKSGSSMLPIFIKGNFFAKIEFLDEKMILLTLNQLVCDLRTLKLLNLNYLCGLIACA